MKTRELFLISLFTALTIISSMLHFTLGPIPFSLQIVIVFIVAHLFSVKVAFWSQALYVIMGLIGLPVFASGGGLFYVIKPTFGFLIGFIVAALVMSLLKQRLTTNNFINTFAINMVGTVIIYIFGCVYFYFIMNFVANTPITVSQTFTSIVLLSAPGDIILGGVTTILILRLEKIMKGSGMYEGLRH
ncbi:biotin transporter BioY [Staphylococcus carnosus]|uniref:biotin transporter BioY n=1 Tax=Staphylococcus carnosus TaxID=1281 RepID=UPI0020A46FC8|nr:biotin transporter BioY [Staphylococcus carnosus]UTB79698.1 BioY family transporter [Staphylococcus carnosus]